ncbi:DMT family transporter [Desulfovibrio sp.]|uniref:DMT family transporter n=1 Tax=Desulfovibrio sp. TaxID=885 RepID=UPI0025BA8729|nr:DMT family transporter [Desulfovibrio sp.]
MIAATRDASVYVRLALVAVAWGGTFIAGRSLAGVAPMFSACLRFVLASAALSLFLLLSGKGFRRVNLRQTLVVTLLGFCGIFSYSFFFFSGLQYISASRAALIVALNPAVMTLIAYLFYRERVTTLKVLGIVLCFCGVALVVGGGDPQGAAGGRGWPGEALIGGCVLSWSAYSVFCKNVVRQLGPLHTVTYSIYAGTVMLVLYAAATGELHMGAVWRFSLTEIASLFYLGVIGSAVAYIWYYDGIQQIGVARASVFIALNPLSAVLFGAALLGEQMTLATLLGGVLIISGIVAENRQSGGTAQQKRQPPVQSKG